MEFSTLGFVLLIAAWVLLEVAWITFAGSVVEYAVDVWCDFWSRSKRKNDVTIER
jgi:hypothetical protein